MEKKRTLSINKNTFENTNEIHDQKHFLLDSRPSQNHRLTGNRTACHKDTCSEMHALLHTHITKLTPEPILAIKTHNEVPKEDSNQRTS